MSLIINYQHIKRKQHLSLEAFLVTYNELTYMLVNEINTLM